MADPNWLEKQDYWQLTVSFWASAAEAGLKPVEAHGYHPDPAMYRPHTIDFSHPPSREDFLQVVKQTPWMHVWEELLLPIVAQNDWPMIDFAHKAGSVELKNANGLLVGRLDVRRQEFFRNHVHYAPLISADVIDRAVNRLPRDKREAARELLRQRENRIQERLSWRKMPFDDVSDVPVAVRQVLVEGGFLQERKATRAKKVPVS